MFQRFLRYTEFTEFDESLSPFRETPLQVFHCLRHDGSGGDTLLVDGFHAAETVRHEDPHAFTDLAQFRVEHEYKGTFCKMTNSLSES